MHAEDVSYQSRVCEAQFIRFQAKRDNAKMTGTGGGKEVKYNEMGVLILDLGKTNPVESSDGDAFLQAETIAYQQQAQLPTSVLPADIRSPCYVRDENRSTYTGLRHTVCVTHRMIPSCT
jgi:hypothetical protein